LPSFPSAFKATSDSTETRRQHAPCRQARPAGYWPDHVEITITRSNSRRGEPLSPGRCVRGNMTATIYNFVPLGEGGSEDETERLFSALGCYTVAELLELLYVGEEPGFFELMRGVFALSDESRFILQEFLTAAPNQTTTATIDPEGRCVLTRRTFEREKPVMGIVR